MPFHGNFSVWEVVSSTCLPSQSCTCRLVVDDSLSLFFESEVLGEFLSSVDIPLKKGSRVLVDESRREVVGVLSLKRGGGKKLVVVFPSEEGGKYLVVPVDEIYRFLREKPGSEIGRVSYIMPGEVLTKLALNEDDLFSLDPGGTGTVARYEPSPVDYGLKFLFYASCYTNPLYPVDLSKITYHQSRFRTTSAFILDEVSDEVGFCSMTAGRWSVMCHGLEPSSTYWVTTVDDLRDVIYYWACPMETLLDGVVLNHEWFRMPGFFPFLPYFRIYDGPHEVPPSAAMLCVSESGGFSPFLGFLYAVWCESKVEGGYVSPWGGHCECRTFARSRFLAGEYVTFGQYLNLGVVDDSFSTVYYGLSEAHHVCANTRLWPGCYYCGGSAPGGTPPPSCPDLAIGDDPVLIPVPKEGLTFPVPFREYFFSPRSYASACSHIHRRQPSLPSTYSPSLVFYQRWEWYALVLNKGSSPTFSLDRAVEPIGFAVVEDLGEPVDGYTVWLL